MMSIFYFLTLLYISPFSNASNYSVPVIAYGIFYCCSPGYSSSSAESKSILFPVGIDGTVYAVFDHTWAVSLSFFIVCLIGGSKFESFPGGPIAKGADNFSTL